MDVFAVCQLYQKLSLTSNIVFEQESRPFTPLGLVEPKGQSSGLDQKKAELTPQQMVQP